MFVACHRSLCMIALHINTLAFLNLLIVPAMWARARTQVRTGQTSLWTAAVELAPRRVTATAVAFRMRQHCSLLGAPAGQLQRQISVPQSSRHRTSQMHIMTYKDFQASAQRIILILTRRRQRNRVQKRSGRTTGWVIRWGWRGDAADQGATESKLWEEMKKKGITYEALEKLDCGKNPKKRQAARLLRYLELPITELWTMYKTHCDMLGPDGEPGSSLQRTEADEDGKCKLGCSVKMGAKEPVSYPRMTKYNVFLHQLSAAIFTRVQMDVLQLPCRQARPDQGKPDPEYGSLAYPHGYKDIHGKQGAVNLVSSHLWVLLLDCMLRGLCMHPYC